MLHLMKCKIDICCVRVQIERVRLSYKSASMRRPSREQEVLHYQWFADLGSVEAQRAVGQIFSHGAMRNPEQAIRYFRCPSSSAWTSH